MDKEHITVTEEMLMATIFTSGPDLHEHYQKELVFQEPINSLGRLGDQDFNVRNEKLRKLFYLYSEAACAYPQS